MDKINWANFNYEDFTQFCNALLTFEFGKDFRGFSAPGKDGGIDGLFNGTYSKITGVWRFQYKFRQGPRIEGVRNLKSQIKSELASLNDEKVFVLITNLELLPQELKELEKSFEEEIENLKKQCICWVWDGAKLFDLYLQYPLLQLWLQDGFYSAQLQDYRSVFKKNMERGITDFSPGTLNNHFISRENDLNNLESFLIDDKIMVLITGEAGIGKTRLIIEFFKTKVDKLDNWTALVLQNRNVEFDKIRKSLSGFRNYIIFIDDAHTYSPEIIADMKALCEGTANKIKLILTSRNLEAFKSLSLIREYEKSSIPHYKLDDLSRMDTESLFMEYIDKTSYAVYIAQLVEISYGKPILIIAILNAIQNNIAISQIRKQGFLQEYVKNYFQSYYNKVQELTGWPPITTKRILQHIALVEPFNYNDNNIVQKISDLQMVKSSDLSLALKILIENGFVDGRYAHSIKPDYYSDILLSDIGYNEVSTYITEFANFLDNIIVNLSSVDEIAQGNVNILDNILNEYSEVIKNTDDIVLINRVLTTIYSVADYRPEIAKKTIQIYIQCLNNTKHIIYKEIREKDKFIRLSSENSLNIIVNVLSYLLNSEENYDFVFRRAFKLFELSGDLKIANIYAFGRRDVLEKFNFKTQRFFIQEFDNKLGKLDEISLIFGLNVLKLLLNLEFITSGASASSRMSINITTYYLPASASVKKLRQRVANSLIKIYQLQNNGSFKLEILKSLLDIPRSILSTNRNSKPYINNEEIIIVLNFLDNESSTFNILEKKEIQDKLYWFQQWGLSTELFPQIEKVKTRIEPKNLTEQLSQLFTQAELAAQNIENYIQEKCNIFVALHKKDQIANSIIEFLEPQSHQSHYFHYFLNYIIEKYPEYAKEIYHQMFAKSSKLFNLYASSILSGAYFIFRDENFYWSQVKILEAIDSSDTDNILLSVYGRRVPGSTHINDRDIAVILKIFKKKRKENNYNLANSIQSLIVAQHPKSLQVCRDFLKRADQKEAEMFFLWLSDNKTASLQFIEELVLKNTQRFYLTYEFERCLNQILVENNITLVFNYLIERFELKKKIVISQKTLMGYEFVPHGDHSHLFDNCPPDYKTEMFIMSLNWYFALNNEGGHLFYAKDLVEYLKPSNSLTEELVIWYHSKILEKADSPEGLERVLETLSIFHTKDDNLLNLVIEAYTIGYEVSEADNELFQRISQQSYFAITELGVKSGTSGEPFQVDLDLQNLLRLKINNLPDYKPVTKFLRQVLKSVDSDIDQSLDRGNFRW